jgi:hypothetical protein
MKRTDLSEEKKRAIADARSSMSRLRSRPLVGHGDSVATEAANAIELLIHEFSQENTGLENPMPLSEREIGFNEAIDAVAKYHGDKSEGYYKALRLIADGTFQARLLSESGFRHREMANEIYGMRKRTAEEIAENDRIDAEMDRRGA